MKLAFLFHTVCKKFNSTQSKKLSHRSKRSISEEYIDKKKKELGNYLLIWTKMKLGFLFHTAHKKFNST